MRSSLFPIYLFLILVSPLSAAFAGGTGCACCLEARLEAARWMVANEREVPGFDAATGRSLLNYPPHRHVEYHHMLLEIEIPDMNVPRFDAVQTLTVSPIAYPLESLALDAALLEIHSVSVEGHTTSFEYDDATLHIIFDPAVAVESQIDIVTTYSINDPPFGLFWTPESDAWPHRAAQLHTQGQPQHNRYWFPMHDFPNARLTTELIVTVPAGYQVISNGQLMNDPDEDATDDRRRWHWLQDKRHVTYLVSLIVGKFDVVDVSRAPRRGSGRRHIAMPVYVPPGRSADVPGTYGRTQQMMNLFERLIDEPYPWHQYAQTVVWNFSFGGMENTGATTMRDTAIFSPEALADGDLDGLISHELAHQWFGNLITCNSWEHIWLNEGFATYFTALWFEERDGIDGYDASMVRNFDRVTARDRAEAPYQPAMASKVWDDPFDAFRRAANPYPKGASVLHMLRRKLGDEIFFRAIALYVDRHRDTSAETIDLRRAFEDTAGENLEQFFRQWVFRPGVPHLNIEIDWESAASELVVRVEQTQNIDGDNPAFEFELPIWIQTGVEGTRSSQTHIEILSVHGRQASGRFPLDAEPAMVIIDPEMTVLSQTSIRQPVRRWVAQLDRGPTLFSRIRAARALSQRGTAIAGPALLRQAQDRQNHSLLRAEAVRALGRGGHVSPILQLAAMGTPTLDDSDLRVAMVEATAQLARRTDLEPQQQGRLKDILVLHAAPEEPSYRTRAAAVTALGQIQATDQIRLIIAAADSESHDDRVRQAALGALGRLGLREGLPTAVRYVLQGTYNRTRPVAIRAVVQLAEHDRESSFQVLTMALNDRERRTWEAAGDALVELGDAGAIDHFEALLELKRAEPDRARIRGWIEQLQR